MTLMSCSGSRRHVHDDGIFVAWVGSQPVHVGLIVDGRALHSRGENGHVRFDAIRTIQKLFTRVEFYSMPVIEIQRVPGMPKDRAVVKAGTVFSDWLEQESFHRDIRINVNGKELQPDDELEFALQETTG
jgi:hypothetical protein